MGIRTLTQTKFDVIKVISGLLISVLVLLAPLTHKEMFSIYLPDLILSKYVLLSLSIVGFYIFIKNYKNYFNDIFFVLFFIYTGFLSVSLLKTYDIESTVFYFLYHLTILFSYPAIKSFIYSKKSSDSFVGFYILAIFFILIFLVVQAFTFNTLDITTGGIWPVPGYPTRYGSTFWDVNHFGIYLVSSMFLLIGHFLSSKKYRLQILFLIPLLLLSLYYTSSRSAFIGLFGSGMVFIFLLITKFIKNRNDIVIRSRRAILTSLSFFILSPLLLIYIFRETFKESFLYRASSFYSHLYLLKVGITTGIENFMFGVGANAFYAYFRESEFANTYYYVDPAALNFKLPLHNLWLEVLAETGLFSFIIFLLIWTILIGLLYKIYTLKNDYFALGLIGSLLSFLIAGFFYSYKNEFFWVIALFSMAYAFKNSEIKFEHNNKIHQPLILVKTYLKYLFKIKIPRISLFYYFIFVINAIIPLTFFLNNIVPQEIRDTYTNNISFISAPYYFLVNMFRYVFGNYSFIGRTVSVFFYFAYIIIFFSSFYKKISIRYFAFLFTFINVICLYISPIGSVSPVTYVVYLISLLVGIIIVLIDFNSKHITKYLIKYNFNYKNGNLVNFNNILSDKILIVIIVWLTALSIYTTANFYQTNDYYDDVVFISELANNRGLLDNSDVYLSPSIDKNVVSFFCDQVIFDSNITDSLDYKKCKLNNIDTFNLDVMNANNKEIFIIDLLDTSTIEKEVYDKIFNKFTIIHTENVSLIFHDRPKL